MPSVFELPWATRVSYIPMLRNLGLLAHSRASDQPMLPPLRIMP